MPRECIDELVPPPPPLELDLGPPGKGKGGGGEPIISHAFSPPASGGRRIGALCGLPGEWLANQRSCEEVRPSRGEASGVAIHLLGSFDPTLIRHLLILFLILVIPLPMLAFLHPRPPLAFLFLLAMLVALLLPQWRLLTTQRIGGNGGRLEHTGATLANSLAVASLGPSCGGLGGHVVSLGGAFLPCRGVRSPPPCPLAR